MPHLQVYNSANDPAIWYESVRDQRTQYGRYPSQEEIRFMSYYAVMHGAGGLSFCCYRFDYNGLYGPPEKEDVGPDANPEQWSRITAVSLELKEMGPILLAPSQKPPDAGVALVRRGPVEIVIKAYEGRTYLLTANPSSDPVQLEIRLDPNRFPNPTITLLPERQTLPHQNGSFTVHWAPYAVRIYAISGEE